MVMDTDYSLMECLSIVNIVRQPERMRDYMSFKIAMLRAFGSKPIVRYVSRSSRGVLLVRSERSYREWLEGRAAKHWIGWPRSEVYKYDESTFCRLEKLYRSGAQEDLGKGWAKCQSWTGH